MIREVVKMVLDPDIEVGELKQRHRAGQQPEGEDERKQAIFFHWWRSSIRERKDSWPSDIRQSLRP